MCFRKKPFLLESYDMIFLNRFAEEDSESNILFDESEEGNFTDAHIKACTIYKLIERLTYHLYAGMVL